MPVKEVPEGFVRAEDVQAIIAAELAKHTASMLELMVERPAAKQDNDTDFARSLALAIAQIADQGTNRKRVAPEVLERRERAWERMVDLILQARERGTAPRYTLVHKVYLDERLIDPLWIDASKVARTTEIAWPGVPSLAMKPANDVADGIFAAFQEAVGHAAPTVVDRLKVTSGGVVYVDGRAPVATAQTAAQVYGEGVQIVGRGMPGAIIEKRVLGTVAPPARQTA